MSHARVNDYWCVPSVSLSLVFPDRRLLELAADAALRQRMGQAALKEAQQIFSMKAVIARTVEVLTAFAHGKALPT